jgi:hypothetical protein
MAPEGTASTAGAGSTIGAAAAPRTGAPPNRVEVHAPSPRAEHITAAVSQMEFFIVVLSCITILMGRLFLRSQGYPKEYEPKPTSFRFRDMGSRGTKKGARGAFS